MLFLLGLLACSCSAIALDRNLSIGQLHHTVWTAKDGTPCDMWAMAQTSDGWMWFGAPSVLYRFNRIRFKFVNRQQPSADRADAVSAPYARPSRELLIGNLPGGVSVLKEGRFTHYRDAEVMRRETVFALEQDGSGAVWASTRDRLLPLDGQRWQRVATDGNYPEEFSFALLVDRSATLWAGPRDHVFSLVNGSRRFESRSLIAAPRESSIRPTGACGT
jgi:ligand-binding sensor domain-containing protein